MVSVVSNEKSYFERNVIEAYMLENPKDLYEKLSKVFNYLNQNGDKIENFNRNIVDKFSRIIERKFINVNIIVAKIFENLISFQEQIDFLSDDPDLIIRISNCILNLLENIKSTLVYKSLETKCTNLLNHLTKLNLSEQQKTMLQELLHSFPTRNHSNILRNFDSILQNIINSLNSDKYEEMAQAISLLIDSFSDTFSLDEQFELIQHFSKIITVLSSKHNKKDLKEIYYQFSNFFCSLLFATKFNLEANTDGYFINSNELNKNKLFLLKDSNLINEYTKNQLSFLHNTGYELTSQKELLLSYNQICEMTVKLVEILLIFEEFFDIQYISFLLLKRIYSMFPKFIIFIEELLVKVLFNLCHFKFQNESDFINESKVFIKYIIRSKDVEDSLKKKVNILMNSYKIDLSKIKDWDYSLIEREPLILNNFNLKVGSPYSLEIDACNSESLYIEVYYAKSIIYIAFALENKDISFEILKYENDDHFNSVDNESDDKDNRKFKSILRLDYIEHSSSPIKFIIFVSQPGLYKIIWDNTYSWFTKKKVRYRVSVLKPSEDNIEGKEKIKEISLLEEDEKILKLTYNNKPYKYNIYEIKQKIKAVKKNYEFYMIIIVLIRENILKIYDKKLESFTEYTFSNNDSNNFKDFCEENILNFINQEDNIDQLVIFINIFKTDKNIKDLKLFENNISRFTLKKNYHVYNSQFIDSCLLYHLYQSKLISKKIISNTIYIHLDKIRPQISMIFEGVINNKIKDMKFDCSKTLGENLMVLLEMISHLVAFFGNFYLVFSFMDYEEMEIMSFISSLSLNLEKFDGRINIERKSKEFLLDVMNYSHLVQPNS